MPGEDEAKETEDGKDESTAEKPGPEPEKTGHWAPFGSPGLVEFSRDSQEVRDPGREETETPTERGGFPQLSPQLASPVVRARQQGVFQVLVGLLEQWPGHILYTHMGVSKTLAAAHSPCVSHSIRCTEELVSAKKNACPADNGWRHAV